MKKLVILMALMTLVSCGATHKAQKTSTDDSKFRLVSYNVWISKIGKGDNAWEFRKDRLAQSIVDLNADVIGMQEVDTRIQNELPGLLSKHGAPEYEWYVFSPYSADGKGNKAQALMYRKDRFKLLESHYFWMSETPEIMSKGWDEVKFYRGGFCVILKDLKTSKEFFLMHSHFPLGKEARANAADVAIAMEKKYNKKGLPSFLIGDLNNRPEAKGSEILRTHWTDTFLALPQELKEGSEGTFNGVQLDRDMNTSARIDYVYFRNTEAPLKYGCFNNKYDGFWPSDHCAVYVEIKL